MPGKIVIDEIASGVLQVVRLIVAHPADVRAQIVADNHHSALQISVHQEDLGLIIGRKGRTAKSLRILLAAAANRLGQPVTLEIESCKPAAAPLHLLGSSAER